MAELRLERRQFVLEDDGRGMVSPGKSTPLRHAAVYGEVKLGTLLLDRGADVDAASREGATGLTRAARETENVRVQVYFESGFPHGNDQWISATGLATVALMRTAPEAHSPHNDVQCGSRSKAGQRSERSLAAQPTRVKRSSGVK